MKICSEKDVKREVKKLLDKHGWFWWSPPAGAYGRVGIADINAIHAGIFLAVETKFGKNKPTAQQRAFLNSIQAEAGFAFVVNEDSLDWFRKWLECFMRCSEAVSQHTKIMPEDGAAMLDAIRVMTEALT